MGDYTLTDFTTELKLILGQRTDLNSYIDNWVNQAYIDLTCRNRFFGLEVPKTFDFPELRTSTTKTTTAGTAYVTSPSDVLYVRHVHDDTNDVKLDKIKFMEYVKDTGRASSASYGKPTKWVRDGGYIYLYPTPDSTYALTVYYRKRPADMTSATSTAIGAEWDEPILYMSAYMAHMRLNEADKAANWQKVFIERVGSMMDIYTREEVDTGDYMKPDFTNKEMYRYQG